MIKVGDKIRCFGKELYEILSIDNNCTPPYGKWILRDPLPKTYAPLPSLFDIPWIERNIANGKYTIEEDVQSIVMY